MSLVEVIPAGARKRVYAVFALVGVVAGGAQVAYASLELGQPAWLTATLAVYAFVGGALGLTAQANTGEQVSPVLSEPWAEDEFTEAD